MTSAEIKQSAPQPGMTETQLLQLVWWTREIAYQLAIHNERADFLAQQEAERTNSR